MINGSITWWEIRVPDVEKAQAFYTAVFGATAQPWDRYVMLLDAEGKPFGALEQTQDMVPTDAYIRSYFLAEDLEAALETITAAGGSVERGRELISEEFGWWALARDPFGNWLGLCTSNAAAGPSSADAARRG
jgi:predicted enzyme related to lactoylglutathione lyase